MDDGRVPAEPGSREPSPSVSAASGFDPSRIAEMLAEGDGFWRTCSGCYESEDGYPVGDYPHSDTFNCVLGGGCGECGGIGATWDTTDYADMADWMIRQDRTKEAIKAALTENLRVFDGQIVGMNDAAYAILELTPCDSDRSGEAGETQSGSGPQDRQRDPQGDAQTTPGDPS